MDISELRIGNYLNSTFQKKTEIETVENICNGLINPWTYDGIENNMQTYSGIPLTEEWLLKFGFEHSGDYYVKDQVYIMIKSYLEPRLYHYKFNYASIDIEYVHQVQNLYYALTGKELTSNKPL